MIRIACPYCRTVTEYDDSVAGKTQKCAKCKKRIRVPVAPVAQAGQPVLIERTSKGLKAHMLAGLGLGFLGVCLTFLGVSREIPNAVLAGAIITAVAVGWVGIAKAIAWWQTG